MLSILCVRLTIKVKVGIPESFKVGWYSPKKLGRVTLIECLEKLKRLKVHYNPSKGVFKTIVIWLRKCHS